MAKRLIPLLDRVLVQKLEAPTKSVGGVLLPDTASKVFLCSLNAFDCIVMAYTS